MVCPDTELLTPQHIITSQKTWIFSNAAVRTSIRIMHSLYLDCKKIIFLVSDTDIKLCTYHKLQTQMHWAVQSHGHDSYHNGMHEIGTVRHPAEWIQE
jgi:hypothetical protein